MSDQPLESEVGENIGMQLCKCQPGQFSALDLRRQPSVVDMAGKITEPDMRQPKTGDDYKERNAQDACVVLPQEARCVGEIGVVKCAQACRILCE